MHEHKFKRRHRTGPWRHSSEPGLMLAYDEWVNLCSCGEERKIKTSPRGKWLKASSAKTGRVRTYPEKWRGILKALIKGRTGQNTTGITFTVDRIARVTDAGWDEIEKLVDCLLTDGIIEKFEPYPRTATGRTKIIFSEKAVQSLKEITGLDSDDRERERIDLFFKTWEYPVSEIRKHVKDIAAIMDELKGSWLTTGKPVITSGKDDAVVMKSLTNYRLLLETLREIFNIVSAEEMLNLRELAIRITGESKGIEAIRPYMRKVLGDLSHYGISEHSPFILFRGPVSGRIGEKVIDLSACIDYVSITVKTSRSFIPQSSNMKRIILVENLTPFERLCREPDRFDTDTGIVFLSGYPPGHVRDFVRKLLAFKPVKGLIWCDLDPDGVEIALTASKWFKNPGWQPLFMEKEFLYNSRTRPLSVTDMKKLSSLKSRDEASVFHSLLSEMETLGIKVEQEAQEISELPF
ncbi:MAG TPA: DUF2399 domain-containing protein [Nitrospirae bacterium]|nr:DUF2399 domain-containing protein [Nitrospirota bacterium]